MTANQSLKRFSGAITALVCIGIIGTALGLVLVLSQLGQWYPSYGLIGFGSILIYICSALIGLAIFGAFLRITAVSIIEGLGGNISITGSTDGVLSGQMNVQPTRITPERVQQTAQQNFPFSELGRMEYEEWREAGEPSIQEWVAAGKPDFMTWLKDNA